MGFYLYPVKLYSSYGICLHAMDYTLMSRRRQGQDGSNGSTPIVWRLKVYSVISASLGAGGAESQPEQLHGTTDYSARPS